MWFVIVYCTNYVAGVGLECVAVCAGRLAVTATEQNAGVVSMSSRR